MYIYTSICFIQVFQLILHTPVSRIGTYYGKALSVRNAGSVSSNTTENIFTEFGIHDYKNITLYAPDKEVTF